MNFAALVVLFVAMLSIQSGASLAKSLFGIMSPEGITSLRLLFAALILLVVWRPWRKRLTRSEWSLILLYGGSLGAMNLFFYLSLARIPLGLAVAFEFTGPLALALISSRRMLDLVWVISAILGVVFLLPFSEASPHLDSLGILLALLAGGCWALYIVFGRRASGRLPAGTTTALGMMCGAILVLPMGLAQEGLLLFDPKNLPMAFAVAVLSSAIPYSLEMFALKRIPTKTFSILMSAEPALAAVSGFIFLSEKLGVLQLLAVAMVVIASAGSSLTAKNTTPTVEL